MPSPITFPVSPLLKWALTLGSFGFHLGEFLVDELASGVDEGWEWRRLSCKFTRLTPAGTVEDAAYVSFDLANYTDGAIDSTWTTADYVAAEARFETFWQAYKAYMGTTHTLVEYRWYRRQFALSQTLPDANGKNGHLFEDSGPPVRLTTKAIVGTAGGTQMPYQVALTVTEKTAWPRHWGRFYLPSPVMSMAPDGRWGSAGVTAIATMAGALMNGLTSDQLPLIVPAAQVEKQAAKAILGVTAVQVDDIPDIQRRRRPKQPAQRAIVVGA